MEAQTTASEFASALSLCGACKESLQDKESKLLPCLHTLCHSCFVINTSDKEQAADRDQTDAASNHQARTQSVVRCPTCKVEHAPGRILENVLVTKTKDPQAEQPQEGDAEKLCTACDEGVTATSYCQECTEWLCDQCVQAHKRVRITKDHTVQPKDSVSQDAATAATDRPAPKMMTCPVHKQEQLKLYCETCQRLTCRDCQLLEHKDHRYAFLEDYAKEYKIFLSSLITKVKEKKQYVENAKSLIAERHGEIQEKELKIVNEIKLFALRVISEMNKRGKQLVSDLNALCSAKTKQLNVKNEEIRSLSSRLDYALKFAEHCAENSSDSELLYTRKLLEIEMRNILRSRCEVPNPHHVLDIKFTYNPTFVLHVGKQGTITVDGIPYPLNQNTIQQAISRAEVSQYNPEQKQQMIHRMKQLFVHQQMQQQGQNLSPTTNMIRPPFPGGMQQAQPMQGPHQSSAVSSSNYNHSNRGAYPANPTMMGGMGQAGRHGGSPPSSNSFVYQNQLGQANLGKINLFQLQQRLQRQHQPPQQQPLGNQPYMQTGAPHSMQNPIVIEPTGEETPPIRKSCDHPLCLPGSCALMGNRGNPVNVMSGSLSQQQPMSVPMRERDAMTVRSPAEPPYPGHSPVLEEDGSQTKPNAGQTATSPDTNRPSCSFSNTGASRTDDHEKAVADFSFDTDPAALLETIRADTAEMLSDTAWGENRETSASASGDTRQTSSQPPLLLAALAHAVENIGKDNTTTTPTDHGDQAGLSGDGLERSDSLGFDTLKHPDPALLSKTHSSDDPSEDYCAVCHNGGDLLCCDTCPKVFHLQCHVPVLLEAPSGAWTCTFCIEETELFMKEPEIRSNYNVGPSGGTKRKSHSGPGLTAREKKVCDRILLGLYSQGGSTPFHEPVSKAVPNYYKIITNPIDFGYIKMKLSASHLRHYQNLEEFIRDVLLVFSNCALYNHKESEVGKAGVRLRGYVEALLKHFVPYLDINSLAPVVEPSLLEGPELKRRRRDRREGSNTSSVSNVSNVSAASTKSESNKEKKKKKEEEEEAEKPPPRQLGTVTFLSEEEIPSDDLMPVEDNDNDSDYHPSQELSQSREEEEEEEEEDMEKEEDKNDDTLVKDNDSDPENDSDPKAKKGENSSEAGDAKNDEEEKEGSSSPLHIH